MHSDPDFWSEDIGFVDFPKNRFLEYTEDHLKEQFQSLDENVVNRLKSFPTLFSTEHESADTRIGKITNIVVLSHTLRIYYELSSDHFPLAKGTLQNNKQKLNIGVNDLEFYRTHWAVKESDISSFYEEYLTTLTGIAYTLQASDKKVQLIYALNGTGKTRLSREFKNLVSPKVDNEGEQAPLKILYYNAFTEDLFYWDNDLDGDEHRKLVIQPNAFTEWVLEEQGQGPTIIEQFQMLSGSAIEPVFSADFSEITFTMTSDAQNSSIKISKGEESNLVWSVFYSLLDLAIEELSSSEDDRSTHKFNDLEYVFIDDPVSSLDDNHLIELAVNLAKLVKSSLSDLKFIITTHNPLFYNVLSNEFSNKLAKDPNADPVNWVYKPKESKKYRLNKNSNGEFKLMMLDNRTPFSYHLLLLSEIKEAINSNQVKKYHFSFVRNILEKTATFLGYKGWAELLPKGEDGNPDPFCNRILNLSSHSAHAGEETGEVEENDKEKLSELVAYLSSKYGFWQQEAQND